MHICAPAFGLSSLLQTGSRSLPGTITRWDRRLSNHTVAVVPPDVHSAPLRTDPLGRWGGGGCIAVACEAVADEWEPNLLLPMLHVLRLTGKRGVA